jgi:hypothetical protein
MAQHKGRSFKATRTRKFRKSLRKRITNRWLRRYCYMPHQGEQECARRIKQGLAR